MAVELRIASLTGGLCVVTVEVNWRVHDVKTEIEKVASVPLREQRLIHATIELQNEKTLQDCLESLHDGEAVELLLVRCNPERFDWITTMLVNGLLLENAPDFIKADRTVVLAAVRHNGLALQYASKEIQRDREVVLLAVQKSGGALQYAPEFWADREVVDIAIATEGYVLCYASDDLRRDRERVLSAVAQNGITLEVVAPEFRSDRDVVLAAVRSKGAALKFASDKLKADHEIVLEAVQQNGMVLQDAPEQLRGDPAIVLAAVKENGVALRFAENDLWADKDVVSVALRSNSAAKKYASAHLFRHPEIASILGNDLDVVCKMSLCTSRRPELNDKVLSMSDFMCKENNGWSLNQGEVATVLRVDANGGRFQLISKQGKVSDFLSCETFAYALTCPRKHVMTRRVRAADTPYVCSSCNQEHEDVQICVECGYCLCRTCAPWDVNLEPVPHVVSEGSTACCAVM